MDTRALTLSNAVTVVSGGGALCQGVSLVEVTV